MFIPPRTSHLSGGFPHLVYFLAHRMTASNEHMCFQARPLPSEDVHKGTGLHLGAHISPGLVHSLQRVPSISGCFLGNNHTRAKAIPTHLAIQREDVPEKKRRSQHLFFSFFILRRMGKNKALAHHTSTYFHTRRVSI